MPANEATYCHAGQLRTRVNVYGEAERINDFRGTPERLLVAQTWCRWQALRGDRVTVLHQMYGRVTHQLVFRVRDDIRSGMVVEHAADGRQLRLTAVVPVGDGRRWLECLAVEVTTHGQ